MGADPHLYSRTSFVLDEQGRALCTREPGACRAPLFSLVRSATSVAWIVRAGVPADVAGELHRFARLEPPVRDLRTAPEYADRYVSLLTGCNTQRATLVGTSGPAFTFPDALDPPVGTVIVTDERLLERNFRGWTPGEIDAGRSPVLAIVEDGYPVSVCFCARRSDTAAEAGLETAEAHRGRGFGPRVAAAWALAIRRSGRTPLYSTFWTNDASLAVARKLGLTAYASHWSVRDAPAARDTSRIFAQTSMEPLHDDAAPGDTRRGVGNW